MKLKVGDRTVDPKGNEYVVTGVWEMSAWIDYELVNINTGEKGALKIGKDKKSKYL